MKSTLLLMVLIFPFACVHTSTVSDGGMIEEGVFIGKTLKTNRYDNLYFSSQPSMKELSSLGKEGFATVINLRDPSEHDEKKEELVAKEKGLAYYNVPFRMQDKFDDHYIDKVVSKIKLNRQKGKILIHCSSGNRVGVFLGGHFYKDHKYSKSKSLSTAKKLGLSKGKAVDKLTLYFESH